MVRIRHIIYLLLGTCLCLGAPISFAYGPIGPFLDEPKDACRFVSKTKCVRTDRIWFVQKADGSGVVSLEIVRDSLNWSKISRQANGLGEPFTRDLKDKKSKLGGTVFSTVRISGQKQELDPVAYGQILPISDKAALVTAYTGENNGFDYHIVRLDGKVDNWGRSVGNKDDFLYVGGYRKGAPAHVFLIEGYDSSTSRFTLSQLDGYGDVKARFDNILGSKDLTFFSFRENGTFIAAAIDPKTGEEGSIRFGPEGQVLGYGPPIAIKQVQSNWRGPEYEHNPLVVVGKLPVKTDLPDDTLYHPINADGLKMEAPVNFIGMARLQSGEFKETYNSLRDQNWVLVYQTAFGYGYKIAGTTPEIANPYMSAYSAHNILAAEAHYKMFSGFGFLRDDIGSEKPEPQQGLHYIVQEFSAYEPDGVTPRADAVPAAWRWFHINQREGLTLADQNFTGYDNIAYAAPREAMAAAFRSSAESRQREIDMRNWAADMAANRRQEYEEQQRALQIKMQEDFEKQQAFEASAARREKAAWDRFFEALPAPSYNDPRGNIRDPSKKLSRECYDQGDGTSLCFTR